MTDFRDTTEEKEILKWILSQTHRSRKKKAQLARRLERIRAESDSPIHSSGFSTMPKAKRESDGVADAVVRISEIEDRIRKQQAATEGAIILAMNILDTLPPESLEKEICELYHIDGMDWKEVQSEIPMSRSQCYKRYNRALEIMLQNQEVRKLTGEKAGEYRAYKKRQGRRRKKKASARKAEDKAQGTEGKA